MNGTKSSGALCLMGRPAVSPVTTARAYRAHMNVTINSSAPTAPMNLGATLSACSKRGSSMAIGAQTARACKARICVMGSHSARAEKTNLDAISSACYHTVGRAFNAQTGPAFTLLTLATGRRSARTVVMSSVVGSNAKLPMGSMAGSVTMALVSQGSTCVTVQATVQTEVMRWDAPLPVRPKTAAPAGNVLTTHKLVWLEDRHVTRRATVLRDLTSLAAA
mmetsp:Transcript_67963/g.112980  ORF Transcript_67963/g.112980 Transcript_67963/m.112980 type:complete len:221 (-) Transcript_67963:160-822(-)